MKGVGDYSALELKVEYFCVFLYFFICIYTRAEKSERWKKSERREKAGKGGKVGFGYAIRLLANMPKCHKMP